MKIDLQAIVLAVRPKLWNHPIMYSHIKATSEFSVETFLIITILHIETLFKVIALDYNTNYIFNNTMWQFIGQSRSNSSVLHKAYRIISGVKIRFTRFFRLTG